MKSPIQNGEKSGKDIDHETALIVRPPDVASGTIAFDKMIIADLGSMTDLLYHGFFFGIDVSSRQLIQLMFSNPCQKLLLAQGFR